MTDFKPGQKWISSAEPELGIGQIVSVEHRFVTMNFDLIDETRTYARNQAHLTRVKFNVGDIIRTAGGLELEVSQVSDQDGILVYHGEYQGTSTAIIETDLDPNVTFSKPEERLFTLQIDDNRWFNLRYQTLQHRARLATSSIKGLLGPRVSLIPHQFFIAQEVASRYAPRVLLADEVGLGKTVEALLILNRMLLTGRIERVLVLVPPALVHQWLAEAYLKFNLLFRVIGQEDLDSQLVSPDDDSIATQLSNSRLCICPLDQDAAALESEDFDHRCSDEARNHAGDEEAQGERGSDRCLDGLCGVFPERYVCRCGRKPLKFDTEDEDEHDADDERRDGETKRRIAGDRCVNP